MGVSFLLIFTREIDFNLHQSIRGCLRYAKLIGPEYDENFLKEYTNILTQRFVEEQVIFSQIQKEWLTSVL